MLDLTKNDMFNYLAIGKLMTVEWAKLQCCSFDLSGLSRDNTQGFDGYVTKVTNDLKFLEYLLMEAKNFNSFPEEIPIPNVPETLKVAIEKCLAKDLAPEVPKLSKRRLRCYSEIDLNGKRKLPRDLFDNLNEGVSDKVSIPGLGNLVLTEFDDTTSTPSDGSTSAGLTRVARWAFDDSP